MQTVGWNDFKFELIALIYVNYKIYFTFQFSSSASITPDLSCLYSGSTAISFSLSSYGSSTPPSWVTINSSSETLVITTPSVNADTEFSFILIRQFLGYLVWFRSWSN